MPRIRPNARLVARLACGVAVLGLAGCYSATDVSFAAIKNNPSPELAGVADRYDDTERNMAMVGDQNIRMMWNDLNRLFLFDAPSTLSPWNIVSTTGQP